MAKIEVNKVELVWPGKYNEDGTLKEVPRVNLPFQVIERVNESRATREAKKRPSQLSLFDVWEGKEGETFEEGWRNKLIWGDNLLVMGSLLSKFAGQIDLIYIDPPFATGADFSFKTEIGDEIITKEQSIIEEKAYRDTWGRGTNSYLQMMRNRLILMRDLLSPIGSIYIHLAHHVGQYMKVLLDEIFGENCFQNEIIWFYKTGGATKERFARKHDNIFFYSKSPNSWKFVPQKERSYMMHQYGFKKSDFQIDEDTGLQYSMVYVRDVWDIPSVGSATFERVGYDTQKPEALLERIILSSSNEGDLVADFFCGSGTTLAVAERLGRRWIGCDLSRYAIHTTRKRLLDIPACKAFEILNLGKYERQYWQSVTFPKRGEPDQQIIFQYLSFILKLYGAQPISGTQHLHGNRGNALIHIGAVDAPVTIDEVNATLEECLALKHNELHILGWEWEMGLNDLMVSEAKRQGVKLLLLQIPRELMEQQAVDRGDIHFFELAYLEVDISKKGLEAQVTLVDFVIPNTELIPEDVREKVQKWSDYIDYWAVDWDFQEDTFIHGWVAYRTRQERKLPLKSDKHTYDKPGKYTIVVKVIDIFGNDTTQAFEVEVK
ncbi:MAG: site-specific DNA-methyltransferase [Acidobacteria bacterium]|nr:site-specific DNA-methyltransferase [Acidobacteriota bacterium]